MNTKGMTKRMIKAGLLKVTPGKINARSISARYGIRTVERARTDGPGKFFTRKRIFS